MLSQLFLISILQQSPLIQVGGDCLLPDSIDSQQTLRDVVVTATNGTRSKLRTENTEHIGLGQLQRAACCNLGESFTANPSVDVSYSDASTGAAQIKLLGLSGTYVQMLTENVPNLRGGALPYSLNFVPGPWMQSIQVSKGAASVKNGYESTTGQINIEFMKPQATDGLRTNAYLDSRLRYELNADGSIHLNDRLSTSLLLHYEDSQTDHDSNGDGFMDMPKTRQWDAMHRWAYVSPSWISQLSIRALNDSRHSGTSHHAPAEALLSPYHISVNTTRLEGQWKNGYMFQDDRNTSIALMLHASWHSADNTFGHNAYNFDQTNAYAQLMYESDLTPHHNIAAGASLNYDNYDDKSCWLTTTAYHHHPTETTPGVYAQYTYRIDDMLSVMTGVRLDHSSIYGTFFTPRLHVKYSPTSSLTFRASAGKGYRTPHALAENTPMMASGRTFFFDDLKQEEAWNYGISASLNIPIAEKMLELNAEYYYTHFLSQMVINIDGAKGANTISFENLHGKSYSHTFQIDATYPFFERFSALAAFRYNDARTTYDDVLRHRPLTSRFKGLLTLSYKTPMELWHFDVTGQLNGHGELYDHSRYPTYLQLQAQVTREFRHCSVYLGGENLTNYVIPHPIINASTPWSPSFDATQVWGPTDGAMVYVGIRWKPF